MEEISRQFLASCEILDASRIFSRTPSTLIKLKRIGERDYRRGTKEQLIESASRRKLPGTRSQTSLLSFTFPTFPPRQYLLHSPSVVCRFNSIRRDIFFSSFPLAIDRPTNSPLRKRFKFSYFRLPIASFEIVSLFPPTRKILSSYRQPANFSSSLPSLSFRKSSRKFLDKLNSRLKMEFFPRSHGSL